MPPLTLWSGAGIILLGGVVGFLSGLFGVGGGFLITPMLNIVFGVPINIAVGSSLCQMIGTCTTATLRHWKESAVDLKLAIILLGGAVGGVEVGTMLLTRSSRLGSLTLFGHTAEWMWVLPMAAFVVLLSAVGVTTLVESLGHHRAVASGEVVPRRVGRGFFNRALFPPLITLAGTENRKVPLLAVIYVGFGVGVIQGFLGVGGFIYVPALIYLIGCSTRMAVGTSLFVVVLSSIAGTISHSVRGDVDLAIVALILVSSTVGASFGAAVHHRLKPHHIRFWFSLVLLASMLIILAKMLYQFGAFGG